LQIDVWEEFLLVESETEAALFARKKNRQKRLGEGADLHLERRIQSEVTAKTDPTAGGDPEAAAAAAAAAPESGAAEAGEPNPDGKTAAATAAAAADGSVASVEGEGAGDAEPEPEVDPDIKAALEAFEKQEAAKEDTNVEPATNVIGMLVNLWSRIPDATVRVTHSTPLIDTSCPQFHSLHSISLLWRGTISFLFI
jgi:hypothetical protein